MIPILETERLWLKGVTLENVPAYNKYFVNYEVIRMLNSRVPWPYPADGAEYFINSVLKKQGITDWLWGIYLKADPTEMIGAVHLVKNSDLENRGFWLGQKFWNQGLMTEAAVAVNDFAFDQLDFKKLIFGNASSNLQSRRIKEKTGAVFLRTEKAEFVDPDLTEKDVWELTKENWQHFKSKKR